MTHTNQFAHTPEKRAGKEPDPARYATRTDQRPQSANVSSEQGHTARAHGFNQETDMTYGGGRWGQRTPKTAHGSLSHGNTATDHGRGYSRKKAKDQGHGRDYNKGSDEQRYISSTPDQRS